jgi:hypothetical protein
MIRFLVDILISFIILGLFEAVIKPFSVQFTKRSLIKLTPLVLNRLDEAFPDLIRSNNAESLDTFVRDTFSELSGEDWSNIDTDSFWRTYDLRVTLDKLNSLDNLS